MRKLLLSLLLPAFAVTPGYSQLSAPEKKAIAYINTHMSAAMQLLIETVNINSGTLNIDGVKKVGSLYAHELEQLGFTIEWVSEPDSLHRAGHLVDYYGLVAERNVLIEERSNDRNPAPGGEAGRVEERWNAGCEGLPRLPTRRWPHP